MNFEISGVYATNKGAVLMLEAIRQRLEKEFPGARFAVPTSWSAADRLEHGLWATSSRTGRRPTLTSLFDLAPGRLHDALGFIPSNKIDVLLDASGFGYGDFWGFAKLNSRLTERLARWKKGGKRAILLPQALGPFEDAGMADSFRKALDQLDLAFVRDNASYNYVSKVANNHRNVRRAPDFTNLLHPELPTRLEYLRGKSVVIPNEKMVTNKPSGTRERYLAFLKLAVDLIAASGREVVILVHEGKQDLSLANDLRAMIKNPSEIVDERSALTTKAIISAADISVSSRFHGLVSGLSSAVPSLACGWSHKYRELMADYGCEDLVADLDNEQLWASQISALIEKANDPSFRESLKRKGAEERQKSEEMWQQVISVIR